jgi:hypothetical protein
VLEHLSLDDLRIALANTYRMLKPGGLFRFVLPDLRSIAATYVSSTDSDASHRFMLDAHLGVKHRPRGPMGLLRAWIGNSSHLWMWDYASLRAELIAAGFRDVRRAVHGDSEDDMFSLVEEESRWKGQLGMECVR